MNTKKECPISATGKLCIGEKCKLWVEHNESAYTKKCEKSVFASDVMSNDDYKTLVKLSLVSENTETALQAATDELATLGNTSIFRPFKSSRINTLRSDTKRYEAVLVSAEKRITAIVTKYAKIASQVGNDLLKDEGWKMSYTNYDSTKQLWQIGGVKVISAVKKGICGLTEEGLDMITNSYHTQETVA